MPLGVWQACGKIHVYLIHLAMEYAESGSTGTLYLHGLTHAVSQAHLPIQYRDEAGERDLRLGKTFATLTTTCPEDSIRQTLTHEHYIKFQARKSRRSQVHLWKPVRRALVLEQCVLSASPEWRVIVERILRPLLALPTMRVLCHPQTRSVLVQLGSEVDAHDVYCICGRCGSERSGRREWVAFHLEALQGWSTFSYVSVGSFVPSRQRRAEAKAQRRAKRKSRVCTVQDAQQVLVVPDPSQVDSSAEYVPPGHVPEEDGSVQRILPMRSAKLHRRIVVDAGDSSEPAGDPQSDIGDSPSGSDSGSESGGESGSGSGSDASDGDATSSAVTVSSSDLEAAAPALPPQKNSAGLPRALHNACPSGPPLLSSMLMRHLAQHP